MNNDLETQIENVKEIIELRDACLRLGNNPDFKKVILEGFCEKEALRYLQATVDGNLSEAQKADSLAMAQASSYLKLWLRVQVLMGNSGERELEELRTALSEVSNEH